jgi:hypothetical protein
MDFSTEQVRDPQGKRDDDRERDEQREDGYDDEHASTLRPPLTTGKPEAEAA